jgi:urease accessory protein
MSWHGNLTLTYRRDGARTVAHDRHDGPLRVLKAFYPEGPSVCHHTLVHPPGGMAGGDELNVTLQLGEGTHAALTTPGATRFYRSEGALAAQRVNANLQPGARLEWWPLETVAYPGCLAENRLQLELADGASAMGWDMLALGLPAAQQAFETGQVVQHLQWPGRWLERGVVAADDRRLLDSPVGFAGRRVLGVLWCLAQPDWPDAQREALLEAARELAHQPLTDDAACLAGCTAPARGVVVLRVLGWRVEPVFGLLRQVRARWRKVAWDLEEHAPRIWAM